MDHSIIRYLANKPITSAQVISWLLLMQEFDITIIDELGKNNVETDLLSRLTKNTDNSPVEDSFLDEHLFAMSAHTPWYVDIGNYLVVGKLSHHISPRER
jgi:hypothetical protein